MATESPNFTSARSMAPKPVDMMSVASTAFSSLTSGGTLATLTSANGTRK